MKTLSIARLGIDKFDAVDTASIHASTHENEHENESSGDSTVDEKSTGGDDGSFVSHLED
jgi:hypothetical protein